MVGPNSCERKIIMEEDNFQNSKLCWEVSNVSTICNVKKINYFTGFFQVQNQINEDILLYYTNIFQVLWHYDDKMFIFNTILSCSSLTEFCVFSEKK